MSTNRISAYFESGATVRPQVTGSLPESLNPQVVPPGFVALPEQFRMQTSNLYQLAYQAARSAANQRLLELLRSRFRMN